MKAAALSFILVCISIFGFCQVLPKFVHFNTDNGLNQSTVWTIEEDFSHRIWFGSPGGIQIYDGFELTNFTGIDEILLRIVKHDSSIYAISIGGLYKINPTDFSFKKATFKESSYYTSKFTETGIELSDYEGKLQLHYNYSLQSNSSINSGNPSDYYSVFEFEFSGFKFYGGANGTYYNDSIPVTTSYCSNFVRYSKSRAFIVTHTGLVEIIVANNEVKINRHFIDLRIESLLIDYNQNLWVGTSDFGAFMIHRNSLKSEYFPKFTSNNEPLSCWTIFEINESPYVATTQGIIPIEKDNWDNDPIFNSTKNIACNTGIDAGDFVLIGTRNQGVFKLEKGQLTQVYFNNDFLLDNVILQIVKNQKGFLASSKHSLIQLDDQGEFIEHTICDYDKMGSYIMELCPTPTGYLAARTSGIVKLDSNLKVTKNIKNRNVKVISMIRKYQNKWWGVSMDAGLFRLDNDTISSVLFPDKHLFTLTNYADTNLWISSVTGVYQYASNSTRPYSYQNGFRIKEYNQSSVYQNPLGFLYYGGVSGILKFHPDSVQLFPNFPTVIINRNGTRIQPNQTIQLEFDQSEIHLQVNPILISDQNLFKIEVTQDSTKLEIFEPTSTSFNIPYGLSSIQITITDLVYHTTTYQEYPIFRKLPFWKKMWFWVLSTGVIILLIIGILSFVGFLKTKKQLRIETEERQINDERLRISKELHDNIGARLTHIISSLDIEMYRNKDNNKSIESINAFARDTMAQLRETIWAVSDKAIFFSEFVTRIEQYIEQINDLTGQNIKFTKSDFIDYELNPTQTINYYRIVQESINNSVKYSDATKIEVSIISENSKITVRISDNGKGFDTKNTRFGTGLKGMKTRSDEVGCKLVITSKINIGTVIEFKV